MILTRPSARLVLRFTSKASPSNVRTGMVGVHPESAGKVIREARQAARMTQLDLAELTGTALPNISAIEAGRRPASDDLVEKVIRLIGPRPAAKLATHRDEVLELRPLMGCAASRCAVRSRGVRMDRTATLIS